MKTRSNMPLFVLEVDNVKTLSNSQIDLLRCGDYLVKKDASGEHAYKVSFKSATGMCITYHDAYCVETQSYDKIDGVWTYNSEDKTIIAEPQLENIVDADGHKRFIEGDITLKEDIEGVEVDYGKWSLSGSHLMFVLALTNTTGSAITLTSWSEVSNITLPQWIFDKIYPIGSEENITITSTYGYDQYLSQSTNPLQTYLAKGTNIIILQCWSSSVLEAGKTYRIQFDLLIDNE